MAYVSLSVNVGSFNDPRHRQGLAHFLEHMIFMGSEKYEEENSYSDHISANGGWCNAYTEFEWTNYHYEITYTGLQVSLDMFASILAVPLLKKSAMQREIKAVESEFQMCKVNDNCRCF